MVLAIISIKLEKELLRKIDYHAGIMGLNRSEFIRDAVLRRIRELERQKPRIIVIG